MTRSEESDSGRAVDWTERSPYPFVELAPDGTIRRANRAARALAGLGDVDPPDLAACRNILPPDIRATLLRSLESGESVNGIESSAGPHTLSWSLRPGPSGDVVAAYGYDITDWVRSRSALLRKDDLLEAVGSAARTILESPDGAIAADEVLARLGRATGVSRIYLFRNHHGDDGSLLASQVAEWTQPHIEPQIGNPGLQGVPYEAAGMGRWARELAEGVTIAGTIDELPPEEQELLRPQGILSIVVTPVLVGDSLWGFIGFDDCDVRRVWSRAELEVLRAAADTVAAAMQRREALEALEESRRQLQHVQRMEAIGRLAGGIAHDFNNLLTGILANAEILLTDIEDPHPARGEAEEIRKSAVRAAGLTRQLLAFSRRQAIDPSTVELAPLVAEMEDLVRRLIGENIRVETRLDREAPAIWADQVQLEQVVVNLVVNARDAMPEGGRLVLTVAEASLTEDELVARNLDPAGRYVLISVADTGVGMPPKTREQAFEPFFTTKSSGTGMGLSIVYGIASQLGGSAWIEPETGDGGTTVAVAFPVSTETPEPASRELAEADLAASKGETILLVEDDDAVRNVTSRILERAGYVVVTASSVSGGLERLHATGDELDLLLTDVGLPDRSGTALAREARELYPRLPVLYISGFPGQRAPGVPLAEGDGPLDFLPKPFTHMALLRRVRERIDEGTRSM